MSSNVVPPTQVCRGASDVEAVAGTAHRAVDDRAPRTGVDCEADHTDPVVLLVESLFSDRDMPEQQQEMVGESQPPAPREVSDHPVPPSAMMMPPPPPVDGNGKSLMPAAPVAAAARAAHSAAANATASACMASVVLSGARMEAIKELLQVGR